MSDIFDLIVLKLVLNHLDNIDRIGKQSEYVTDIPVACKELIKQIKKKDKLHFEALEISTNL